MNVKQHFKLIEEQVEKCYEVAREARKKGFDPVLDVETPVATSLAEKALGLISVVYPQLSDKRITNRILELEKEHGQLDTAVAFKIAEEIAKEKYCKFKDLLEAIDAGIRVGFAYVTLGVVSSPIEGFTGIKTGKTRDGKEYLKAYFSGPIRSAGTTASCVVLMLIDYLRETFGFAKFDPDENEIKRYITENYDYHERVTNLQYLPTEDEIEFLAKNLPIQIAGEPTEKREVSNYKDLERVDTNFIRGGMCLIFSEGLAQKAQKGVRLLKGVKAKDFTATGFDYLDEYIERFKMKKKSGGKSGGKPVYIKDIVAGRPVFSHPSRSGGFRFRYGRSRSGGFSATLVHPATMAISNSFLSSGTQLKIEKPTKGCAITVCDSIDGPIVKLKNGSVRKVIDFEEGKKIYSDVEETIYFGDILFPFGDVANRNYDLLKPG
ncbi:MAG: DNA polymerase II large subunit, partial [Nanoarchaeota archaeon]|nr:DNA polymerase II large subunit [Nanoarchaeota archaeon]